MPQLKFVARLSMLSVCLLAVSLASASGQNASAPSTPATPWSEVISPLSSLAAPGVPRDWIAPDNTVFYDHPLILRQYGYGVLTGLVAGSLGF